MAPVLHIKVITADVYTDRSRKYLNIVNATNNSIKLHKVCGYPYKESVLMRAEK